MEYSYVQPVLTFFDGNQKNEGLYFNGQSPEKRQHRSSAQTVYG